MNGAPSSEADAFALCMIAVIVCGMGFVSLIVFSILRNAARRNHEVEDLIDEVGREEAKEKHPAAPVASPKQSWEKDGDWWKK